jgi:hypothetical protein
VQHAVGQLVRLCLRGLGGRHRLARARACGAVVVVCCRR